MIEIKYRDPDGDECSYITAHHYLANDVGMAASEIAEEDYRDGDLYGTDDWPREYEIFHESKWVKVSVDMDYDPTFSATVNSQDQPRP